MLTLLVLRHGKTDSESSSGRDIDRELSKRGLLDLARVTDFLLEKSVIPQQILCSSARRTVQTAEAVLERLPPTTLLTKLKSLYLAEAEVLFRELRAFATAAVVMIVGHNPGLEELVTQLSKTQNGATRLSTSALVALDFPIESWDELEPHQGTVRFATDPSPLDA